MTQSTYSLPLHIHTVKCSFRWLVCCLDQSSESFLFAMSPGGKSGGQFLGDHRKPARYTILFCPWYQKPNSVDLWKFWCGNNSRKMALNLNPRNTNTNDSRVSEDLLSRNTDNLETYSRKKPIKCRRVSPVISPTFISIVSDLHAPSWSWGEEGHPGTAIVVSVSSQENLPGASAASTHFPMYYWWTHILALKWHDRNIHRLWQLFSGCNWKTHLKE